MRVDGESRLDDQPQADLLAMLLRVRPPHTHSFVRQSLEDQSREARRAELLQALVGRLPALQDLAAHHAASDRSANESSSGTITGEAFREGMEGDERECTSYSPDHLVSIAAMIDKSGGADLVVCDFGQDSGRLVKNWYDSSWAQRTRRT